MPGSASVENAVLDMLPLGSLTVAKIVPKGVLQTFGKDGERGNLLAREEGDALDPVLIGQTLEVAYTRLAFE